MPLHWFSSMSIPLWIQAGLWGFFGASSLVLGAAVAYSARLGVRVTAAIMSFGWWVSMAVLSGLAALAGAAFLGGAPPRLIALVQAVAAGALLTMVADTMIPEAVEGEHGAAGLLVVLGLLVAFFLSHQSP